jgi:hypothetical protein
VTVDHNLATTIERVDIDNDDLQKVEYETIRI